MNKVAFLFPGQGAQYPRMGRDFYEAYPEARAVFDEADRLLGKPFSKLIFEGPADELTLTKNAQLAIFITSCAILKVLDLTPAVAGGLSLGEYTALVASGQLSFKEALLLVKARGELMDQACVNYPGTMNVVIGLSPEKVAEVVGPIEGVWVANVNCPGQVVISGTCDGMDKAALALKEAKAKRVLPLDISGAFHSGLMQDAQNALQPLIDQVTLNETDIRLVMNTPGAFVSKAEEVKANMTLQVTHPVLWQSCIEAMLKEGVDTFVEIGPGKSLAGMNKRMKHDAPTISIEKVEDLEGVLQHVTS